MVPIWTVTKEEGYHQVMVEKWQKDLIALQILSNFMKKNMRIPIRRPKLKAVASISTGSVTGNSVPAGADCQVCRVE